MSDINKIVAAILTAGRMPTLNGPREADDWLTEYKMWVETLDKQDQNEPKRMATSMADGFHRAVVEDR